MRILVTGATGFIGKHLVSYLLSQGIKIVIIKHPLDKSDIPKGVISYSFKYDTEKDIEFLRGQKIEGIIHLASLFLALHTSKDVKSLIDTNLFFSTYLLECSASAGIKWFINTGTFWQNYQNADYSPVNLYAATKEAFQTIAQFYIETNQIHFNTLKLSDTYGPNDTRPKIINLFEKIAKSGESLDMSPGAQTIDVTYIDDIVDAYYKLLLLVQSSKTENGAVFAVKAKERLTLMELANKFQEVTGQKLKINWGKRKYREREVMIPWEKGEIVPGWEPKITLEDGIRSILK